MCLPARTRTCGEDLHPKQHPSVPALGTHCSRGSDYQNLFGPYKGVTHTQTLLETTVRTSVLTGSLDRSNMEKSRFLRQQMPFLSFEAKLLNPSRHVSQSPRSSEYLSPIDNLLCSMINTMEVQLLAAGLHRGLVISIPRLSTATTVQETSVPSSQQSLQRFVKRSASSPCPAIAAARAAERQASWRLGRTHPLRAHLRCSF